MQRRIILFFDVAALAGFGVYLALTVWQLPETLRGRLLATSLSLLTRLTTGTG